MNAQKKTDSDNNSESKTVNNAEPNQFIPLRTETQKTKSTENENSKIDFSDYKYEGNFQTQIAAKALTAGGLIKVPESPKELDGRDNVYRRVAKFLLLIGVDEAAKILPHLSEKQTEKIIPEISTIRSIDKSEAKEILQEFKGLYEKSRESGGVETAKSILTKAYGSEKASSIMDKISSVTSGKPFEYLYEADAERVSVLLSDESNPVKALVLSFLKPKTSAAVISAMNEQDKKDIILRLARLKEMSPEVIKRVDKSLQDKMNALAASKSDKIDGKSTLAQILKRMTPETEQSLLDSIAENDPDLGKDLREKLFTIEDIINCDDRYLQEYLREGDEEELACLLTGKDMEFRNKILSNVSENKRKSIIETEEYLKPFRKSDVEKATSKFFSNMRRAYEEGKLIINGRDDEIYV